MSAHDIIMVMINGMKELRTKIDSNGQCFECAAANAILHTMGMVDTEEVENHVSITALDINRFKRAVDCLRQGYLKAYNVNAGWGGFAQIIPIFDQELPYLGENYTEEQLKEYEKLAKYQLTV